MYVTVEQIAKVADLNARASEPVLLPSDMEVVSQDDPRAAGIAGRWFGIYIGILPDGSSHS